MRFFSTFPKTFPEIWGHAGLDGGWRPRAGARLFLSCSTFVAWDGAATETPSLGMPILDQHFLQDSKQFWAHQFQLGSSLALQSIASPFEQFLLWQHIPPSDLLNNTAPRTTQYLVVGAAGILTHFSVKALISFRKKKNIAFYEGTTFQPRLHLDAGLMGQRPSPNP